MIWNVKILLAKIKDCKGKELNFPDKKKLATKTSPKYGEKTFSRLPIHPTLSENENGGKQVDIRVF